MAHQDVQNQACPLAKVPETQGRLYSPYPEILASEVCPLACPWLRPETHSAAVAASCTVCASATTHNRTASLRRWRRQFVSGKHLRKEKHLALCPLASGSEVLGSLPGCEAYILQQEAEAPPGAQIWCSNIITSSGKLALGFS